MKTYFEYMTGVPKRWEMWLMIWLGLVLAEIARSI